MKKTVWNAIVGIPVDVIRSAQFCVSKDETRFNLNGILIGNDGDVVATNGHLLYRARCDFQIKESIIIYLDSHIPATANSFELNFIDDKIGYARYSTGKGYRKKTRRTTFEYSDAKTFPEYSKAIKPTGTYSRTGFNVDANYLALISKVFPGKAACKIIFNDRHFFTIKPLNIRSVKDEEMILMGVLDKENIHEVKEIKE